MTTLTLRRIRRWRRATAYVPRPVRIAMTTRAGKLGAAMILLVGMLAFVGPYLAPHSHTEIVGTPFLGPSSDALLGTDFLGRDALSRFLAGGAYLVVTGFVATVLAYLVGIPVGIAAGFFRGPFDLGVVGIADLIISFPAIVLVLVLLAGAGTGVEVVIAAIALIHVPRIIRLVRIVTMEIATLEYVEAAVARGERMIVIFKRDILANMWTPLLADFGIRMTGSIIIVSSISYLGLGAAPPAANWGLMISENRLGLLTQPWVLIVPALAIGLFAIGISLVADAVARSVGRSIVDPNV